MQFTTPEIWKRLAVLLDIRTEGFSVLTYKSHESAGDSERVGLS